MCVNREKGQEKFEPFQLLEKKIESFQLLEDKMVGRKDRFDTNQGLAVEAFWDGPAQ